MSDDIIIPIISGNNGDRPETLIREISEAYEAGVAFEAALARLTTNGRNFIGEPERLTQALKQRSAWRASVNKITDDLMVLGRGIQKQKRGAS